MKIALIFFAVLLLISFVSPLEYNIEFNQIKDEITITENNILTSNEKLDKTDIGYYFIKKVKADNDYETLNVKLILDKGVTVEKEGIFPQSYTLGTDGEKIIITWTFSNVSKDNVFAFFVSLEDSNKSLNQIYFYIFAGLFLIIIIFLYFKFYKKSHNPNKYLLDDEKKVLDLLKQAEGKSLWQKNIRHSLIFSKAKLSRLIRNLESRNLIEKIPIGNTNKIRLK